MAKNAPDNRTGKVKTPEGRGDGYKDYGNYGSNKGDKRFGETWKPDNKKLYDRVGGPGMASEGCRDNKADSDSDKGK
jgi:hypothetical protein